MKSKSNYGLLLVFFVLLSLIIGCSEPQSPTIQSYSTPTITGSIILPSSSTVSPSDVYVKAVDSDGNTKSIQHVNADKTFVVQNLDSSKNYSLIFTSVAPDFENRAISREANENIEIGGIIKNIVPATDLGQDVGTVKLKPLGTIKGKALIEGKEEHYDISVYIPGTSYIAKTDKDGSFSIYNVPEGSYTIRYVLNDYIPVMIDNVILVSESDTEGGLFTVKDVTLRSSLGTIKGVAKLGDASDSVGIAIHLESEDKSVGYDTTTTGDGFYVINNVAPGTYRVIASYSGYLSQAGSYFTVEPATITNVPDNIVLFSNIGTIKGYASLSNTDNKNGISILIKDKNSSNSFSVLTDENGLFQKIVKPGEYTVSVNYAGYASKSMDITVLENSTTDALFTPLLPNSGTIEGKSNSPEEQVSILSFDGTPIATVMSGQDCSYRFENISTGTYSVKFSKTGFASFIASDIVITPASVITVNGEMLKSSFGSVRGTSYSTSETVSLLKDGTVVESVITADNKSYSFTGIEPGKYTVRFSKEGFSSFESDALTISSGSKLTINGGELISIFGSVSGFVFLEGSVDCSGVTITLTNSTILTHSITVSSASDGSFRFEKLEKPGRYLLTYSKDGYVINNSNSVEVTLGSTSYAGEVTLKSTTSTVRGIATLKDAVTYENISVLLKNETNQYNTTTDQKGNYILNRVLPGTYTLIVSKDGFVTSQSSEIVIEPSCEKTLDAVVLDIAIRSVIGKVSLELKDDYSGALITATNLADNTLVYSAISNSSGDYTLAGMKPGEYSVVISYNGYRTETISPTVNVVSSTVTRIPDTKLNINRGTISGSVRLEGRSDSSGIKVELMRGSEVCDVTTTDKSGNYSVYVPQGNYSGVRYSNVDFASATISKGIALFADNYVSMGDEVLAATHNTIVGKVDVLTTTDESAVTVSFDGIDSIDPYITAADGSFKFEHVSVGQYVMRFKRTDCSDITVNVDVKAADVIDLKTITVTPNTATIKGTVILDKALDSYGVKVSVDLGEKVLETTTDTSGRYELGGVSVADEYTVTYTKTGWNSKSQTISPKLNVLEVRELPFITLSDTTAPVIKSVTINNGSNTTANRAVTLHIDAEDNGSGLNTMLIFDSVNPQKNETYSSMANWTFESRNGEKTVSVRVIDRAGNVSNTVTATVKLTDQKTQVSGVLSDADLVWTKELSPYYVVGNIMVEDGKTLTIKPGVDVQFSGNYYIHVNGTLSAVGTENERIKFYGVEAGKNNWQGMKFGNDRDSVLSYVDIYGLTNGINGYCDIDHAKITANGWALGNNDKSYCDMIGSLIDSTVSGNVSIINGMVNRNNIQGDAINLNGIESVFDNNINGNTIIQSSNIDGNVFLGARLSTYNSFVFNGSVPNFVGFRVPNVSLPASIEDL